MIDGTFGSVMKRIIKLLSVCVLSALALGIMLIAKRRFLNASESVIGDPNNALQSAISRMDFEKIKAALHEGVDLNKPDKFQQTPLSYLLSYHSDDIRSYTVAKMLIEAKANVNHAFGRWTMLHQVIRIKKAGLAKLLLEAGALVNAVDEDGRTPLHHACVLGFTDGVKLLLAYGACQTTSDKKGLIPLHLAAGKDRLNWSEQADYCKIIRFLAQNRAVSNIQDRKGRTALHFAAMYGCHKVVEELIEQGANSLVFDQDRAYPLHYSAGKVKVTYADKTDYSRIVKTFVKTGVCFDWADKYGKTPLHYAAAKGNDDIALFLIRKGSRVNSLDNQGATPLHYALGKDSKRFVPLKYAEHILSVAQLEEYSPLYRKEEEAHARIILELLQHGARCNAKDYAGYTPLHYAEKNKHNNLKRFLHNVLKQVSAEIDFQYKFESYL